MCDCFFVSFFQYIFSRLAITSALFVCLVLVEIGCIILPLLLVIL